MSTIKQISVFNGNNWNTSDIGADASNIDITSGILGSNTNVQSALTTIGNRIGTTDISGISSTITGAINTLNTELTTKIIILQSNVFLYIYGKIHLLYFRSPYSITSASLCNIPESYRPNNNQIGNGRWIDTSNKYFPSLIHVDASNGNVSASYYIPNSTSATSITNGTMTGFVIWIKG